MSAKIGPSGPDLRQAFKVQSGMCWDGDNFVRGGSISMDSLVARTSAIADRTKTFVGGAVDYSGFGDLFVAWRVDHLRYGAGSPDRVTLWPSVFADWIRAPIDHDRLGYGIVTALWPAPTMMGFTRDALVMRIIHKT